MSGFGFRPLAGSAGVVAALGAALLAAPQAAHAQQTQRFTLDGQRVEVYNVVGEVTIRRGGGGAVVIQATRVGSDAEALEFATDREEGAARFRVVYPLDRVDGGIYSRDGGTSGLRLRSDGTFGGDGGRMLGGGGSRIRIGPGGDFRGAANLEITVPDGRNVTVHLVGGSVDIRGTRGDFVIDTWSAGAIASDISGSYLFDTGSGDVEVSNVDGELRIDTGSGDARVTGVRGELLDCDTGSGEVVVTDAVVDRFRFDTGSGSVRARNVTARRGSADTGSGDVEISYSGGEIDDLLVDTGSGEVTLALPQSVDARLVIETGSGDIEMQRSGAVLERRSRGSLSLRLGQGRGRVHVDTGSGDVTIR